MDAEIPLTIDDGCTACGACLLTCPEHALRPAPGRPTVLAEVCTRCAECVEICPADAITLIDAESRESRNPGGGSSRA